MIFDAKEFLNADVMMSALVVIGAIGFIFERLVFGSIEKRDRDALGHDARREGMRSPRGGAKRRAGRNLLDAIS